MVKDWLTDTAKLLFPNLCLLCKQDILSGEEHICSTCLSELPYTNFHKQKENALQFLMRGRFAFDDAMALVYFNTKGKVQEVLHEIKYKGNSYLAEYLGKIMAQKLEDAVRDYDCIIPVPLHKRRKQERGYNQSILLADGISSVLDIPVISNQVSRIKYTDTQTHKTKSERFENMKNAFQWRELKNKKILLVDDVITTGSTIESLVLAMPKKWKNSISILSFSVTSNS